MNLVTFVKGILAAGAQNDEQKNGTGQTGKLQAQIFFIAILFLFNVKCLNVRNAIAIHPALYKQWPYGK